MSDIAGLFNVPTTDTERSIWSFAHATHHQDIIRVIFEITGISLASYILDPFDINNSEIWADQHQIMHSQMDQILGISPFNLDSWDWKDKSTLAGNVYNNAIEHYQAAAILEIG
jgi:hypothetical protein